MTVKEWLQIPDDDLLVTLAEVLPELRKIDWNTAKYWKKTCTYKDFDRHLSAVLNSAFPRYSLGAYTYYAIHIAQPKHYLIAAAMAAERSKE